MTVSRESLELRLEELTREEATIRKLLEMIEHPEYAEALQYLAAMGQPAGQRALPAAPLLTVQKRKPARPSEHYHQQSVEVAKLRENILQLLAGEGRLNSGQIIDRLGYRGDKVLMDRAYNALNTLKGKGQIVRDGEMRWLLAGEAKVAA